MTPAGVEIEECPRHVDKKGRHSNRTLTRGDLVESTSWWTWRDSNPRHLPCKRGAGRCNAAPVDPDTPEPVLRCRPERSWAVNQAVNPGAEPTAAEGAERLRSRASGSPRRGHRMPPHRAPRARLGSPTCPRNPGPTDGQLGWWEDRPRTYRSGVDIEPGTRRPKGPAPLDSSESGSVRGSAATSGMESTAGMPESMAHRCRRCWGQSRLRSSTA